MSTGWLAWGPSPSEGPQRLLEEKDKWEQKTRKVHLGKYLSRVIKQPLISGLFLIGSDPLCHLMPHSGFHVTKHTVQPYFNLEEELWVRLHKPEKDWLILSVFFQPAWGSEDKGAPALYPNQMPEGKGRFCDYNLGCNGGRKANVLMWNAEENGNRWRGVGMLIRAIQRSPNLDWSRFRWFSWTWLYSTKMVAGFAFLSWMLSGLSLSKVHILN